MVSKDWTGACVTCTDAGVMASILPINCCCCCGCNIVDGWADFNAVAPAFKCMVCAEAAAAFMSMIGVIWI